MTGNLVAFEAINHVRLEIRMMTADYHGRADLTILVLAHPVETLIGERPSLDSVSVKCSGTRLRTMEAALIHALYLLDAQLASQEMAGSEGK